jgi:hypothetical protein
VREGVDVVRGRAGGTQGGSGSDRVTGGWGGVGCVNLVYSSTKYSSVK